MSLYHNFLLSSQACPFNAHHVVAAPELRYHIQSCSDRIVIEQDKIRMREDRAKWGGDTSVPSRPPVLAQGPPCDEDWDAELAQENGGGRAPSPLYTPAAADRDHEKRKTLAAMTADEKRLLAKFNQLNLARKLKGQSPLNYEDFEQQNGIVPRRDEGAELLARMQQAAAAPTRTGPASAPPVFAAGKMAAQSMAGIGRGRRDGATSATLPA